MSVILPASADPSLSGRIRNLIIRSIPHTDWFVEDGQGGWAVAPKYALKGMLLTRDGYRAEDNEAGWAKYKLYLDDWQAGRTTSPFPFHLLPQIAQDRQRGLIEEGKLDPWAPAKHAPPTTGKLSEDEPVTPKKGK